MQENEMDETAIAHAKAIVTDLFGPPGERAFDVAYWNGGVERGNGTARYSLRITKPGALRRMLLPPSEVSIVEAYLSGDVDVEGDLERAVTLGDAINTRLKSPRAIS